MNKKGMLLLSGTIVIFIAGLLIFGSILGTKGNALGIKTMGIGQMELLDLYYEGGLNNLYLEQCADRAVYSYLDGGTFEYNSIQEDLLKSFIPSFEECIGYNSNFEDINFRYSFENGVLKVHADSGLLFNKDVRSEKEKELIDKQNTVAFNKEPTDYDKIIEKVAKDVDVDKLLLKSLIKTESDFDPKAVSVDGAMGLTQLMPCTAREVGLKVSEKHFIIENGICKNVKNCVSSNKAECDFANDERATPEQSILGGAKYLKKMLVKFGDVELALAAYNAGPGRVSKDCKGSSFDKCKSKLPDEAENYVPKVLAFYEEDTNSITGAAFFETALVEIVPVKIKYESEVGLVKKYDVFDRIGNVDKRIMTGVFRSTDEYDVSCKDSGIVFKTNEKYVIEGKLKQIEFEISDLSCERSTTAEEEAQIGNLKTFGAVSN